MTSVLGELVVKVQVLHLSTLYMHKPGPES